MEDGPFHNNNNPLCKCNFLYLTRKLHVRMAVGGGGDRDDDDDDDVDAMERTLYPST